MTEPRKPSRNRLVLLGAAALVPVVAAVAVFQGSLQKRDEVQAEPLGVSMEICYDEANGRLDIGCAIKIAVSRTDANPIADASEVLELSRTDKRYSVGCHSIMHALGQKVAQTSEFNKTPEVLRDLWGPCGYGLLHGVFEKVELPRDPEAAAAKMRTACDVGGIRTDERLHGECLHALGHAAYDHFGEGGASYQVCVSAFPGTSPGMTPARTGCFSGLAMKTRDMLIQRILDRVASVEPTVEGFATAGRICSLQDDLEWVRSCAPGFVQVATEYGASHMPSFLNWCSSLLQPSALDCYRQAGVYMGHFNSKFDSLEQVMTICGEGEAVNGEEVVDVCRASVAEGLQNIGDERPAAVDKVCQVLATVPRGQVACDIARNGSLG